MILTITTSQMTSAIPSSISPFGTQCGIWSALSSGLSALGSRSLRGQLLALAIAKGLIHDPLSYLRPRYGHVHAAALVPSVRDDQELGWLDLPVFGRLRDERRHQRGSEDRDNTRAQQTQQT